MERLACTILLAAAWCHSQVGDHPISQPSSYGYSFEGPALALECVALSKANPDPGSFFSLIRAKSPQDRKTCLSQLLQALTPEPDFTANEFRTAMAEDPYHNLAPKDRELSDRMLNRIGVNLNIAKAVLGLAVGRLIDDPDAIQPMIRCLDHPLLDVSRICEDALVELTHHVYGWYFYYDQPPPPTEEARHRFIADWQEWAEQMNNGHPIFDHWLESECLSAVRQIILRLTPVLRGTVAYGYLENTAANLRLENFGGPYSESLFDYDVGSHSAANWPPGTKLDRIAIHLFRPGVSRPRSKTVKDGSRPMRFGETSGPAENTYRELFAALDLEVEVTIATPDPRFRDACFLAIKEALQELRSASGTAPRAH
jgi:hypothetical protein